MLSTAHVGEVEKLVLAVAYETARTVLLLLTVPSNA